MRGVPPVVERMLSLQPADLAGPTVVEFELRAGLERLPESRVRRGRGERAPGQTDRLVGAATGSSSPCTYPIARAAQPGPSGW